MLANLIPDVFFAERATWLLWLLTLAGMGILVFGADRAVSGAVGLASSLGMSKVLIGATVVSLGTTAPETAVSVMAAFDGEGGLALGNGVGSIICDTALIFGFCCAIVSLPKDRFLLNRHGWLQLGSGVMLAGVLAALALAAGGIRDVAVPRWVGLGFLVLLVGYLFISVRWARQHPPDAGAVEGVGAERKRVRVAPSLLAAVFGLALVVGGANVLVSSVRQICLRLHVPRSVLAVTVVAFGTSLPELATALAAVLKKHPEVLLGNVIGADILNVLFVIGASAAAVPLAVPPEFYYLHIPVMLGTLGLLRLYIYLPGHRFRRWQGGVLLAVFVGYCASLLVLVLSGVLTLEA